MSVLAVRVYYEDTDAGGVVYHANHIKYFERGRTEWLRELGYDQDVLMKQDLCFVVRSLNIDYKLPALFNQMLSLETTINKMKRASLVFEQTIRNADQQVIAQGMVTVACVTLSSMKATAIPETLKEDLLGAL
ncbi:tol-pal system-associated acyl-CoA thioesterase [Agarivorans sp. B2Z047]|uniref:tol-pal system-associated acyl-CoA thioesterase n=1 Tax=Agarivorans sp. B2Z047 TaxID=2652721 RepID=UPI00128AED38|nr:tol-pal system-associated acyl-CoA thioesterase [Agarivorans sp. B2Z047]MPW29660.1 tol-pal system-associated acyl-CoA thioesterase [Agarivorans sp. B2Z047]UQN40615.1 tol-pal system-associated acyl-CoA thioesterase [Agarivorans sp. B2Z047]